MKRKFVATTKGALVMLFLLNVIIGVEPQLRFQGADTPITNASYAAWLQSGVRQWGDHVFTHTVAAATYPGAWVGAKIHNRLVVK